jgi:hypothetical protein
MLGVPTMACMTPESQMSEAEQACCKAMAHQCGDMADTSGHSCCETVVQHHDPAILKSVSIHSPEIYFFTFAIESSLVPALSDPFTYVRETLRHPPPGSASPSIEILRI